MPDDGFPDRHLTYERELPARIEAVFRDHPELPDHRSSHNWVTACLGDPFEPVWFVAENPSLTQMQRAVRPTPELQWNVSPGDKLLRQQLVKFGFKDGSPDSPGGWRCYITDVVKSADIVNAWNRLPEAERQRIAEAWAPVLAWELQLGQPRIVVSVGDKADRLLDHLLRRRLIPPLPTRMRVAHYSYIASRPDARTHLGPRHPERLAAWDEEFAAVARALHGHDVEPKPDLTFAPKAIPIPTPRPPKGVRLPSQGRPSSRPIRPRASAPPAASQPAATDLDFDRELRRRINEVFRTNPRLPDHRSEFPWVTAYLGDPHAPVWFMAEYPSLTQVEREGAFSTVESQWNVSIGDRLFREMLAKHGFKTGGGAAPGGWQCYITDIVKSSYRAAKWNAAAREELLRIAEAWAPVLAWELENGRPQIVVVLGNRTKELLDHLVRRRLVPRPSEVLSAWSYAYVTSRPDSARKLGPMHPIRLAEYDEQFAVIAQRRDELAL